MLEASFAVGLRRIFLSPRANVWAQVPPTGISRGNSLVTYSQLRRKIKLIFVKNYRFRCQNTPDEASFEKDTCLDLILE